MSKIARFLVLLSCVSVLVACGDKDEAEKTAERIDRAEALIAEQNSLATSLNSSGTPREYWTETQLDDYENRLNRLAAVEAEIRSLDSAEDNITTWNTDNTAFIVDARADLAEARRRKLEG